MPTTNDFRRENLRKLSDSLGGPSALAKKLGYSNSSFIVQMVGPNPIRQVSESTAQKIEHSLGLVPGSLDVPIHINPAAITDPDTIHARQAHLYRKRMGLGPEPGAGPADSADVMSREQLASLVSLIGKLCNDMGAELSINKFADIIALTILAEPDKKTGDSEDYIKRLVALAK